MPAKVNEFVSSFKKELARPSRFDVFLPVPPIMAPFYKNINRQLQFRCEVTELPGRSFGVTQRKFGSAPVEKFPSQTEYSDIQMTFIVGGDMSERLFFDQWMDLINPSYSYNFRYKTEYAVDIAITQYDMQNKVTYKSVLINAFPVSVGQLDLDWTADNYHRLPVMFAYTKWEQGTVSANETNLGIQSIAGISSNF